MFHVTSTTHIYIYIYTPPNNKKPKWAFKNLDKSSGLICFIIRRSRLYLQQAIFYIPSSSYKTIHTCRKIPRQIIVNIVCKRKIKINREWKPARSPVYVQMSEATNPFVHAAPTHQDRTCDSSHSTVKGLTSVNSSTIKHSFVEVNKQIKNVRTIKNV